MSTFYRVLAAVWLVFGLAYYLTGGEDFAATIGAYIMAMCNLILAELKDRKD